MSVLPSQTIEEAPASYSWTAKHRVGEGWKYSCPVEFAIAPTSAVPVRYKNAHPEFITQGFVGFNMVNLCASAQVEAEKTLTVALGNISRECR